MENGKNLFGHLILAVPDIRGSFKACDVRIVKKEREREKKGFDTRQSRQNLCKNVVKCIKVSSGYFRCKTHSSKDLRPWRWIRWKILTPLNPPQEQTRLVPNGVNVFANVLRFLAVRRWHEWKRIMEVERNAKR